MKKLLLVATLFAVVTACSHVEPPPSEAGALPLPDSAPANGASASAASAESSGSDSLLAASENSGSSATATESKAADSLLATPVEPSKPAQDAAASTNLNPAPEALTPPTPAPLPEPDHMPPAEEPKVAANHEVPPPSPMPASKSDPRKRDIYEEYKSYKEQAASRKELNEAYEERAMFPHEDGAFQIGLDYVRKAFPGYDFDPTLGVTKADSMGGVLGINYFPLRSLSYGRLGVGVNYAMYWTKYEIPTTGTTVDVSKVHSITSFGSKFIYEFDYWLGQLIVPFAFYGFDKVSIKPYKVSTTNAVTGTTTVHANFPSTTFNRQAYGAGAHLNLNRLEPSSASRGLAALGIRKTYLTYTFLEESKGGTGASHLLGLRFEF